MNKLKLTSLAALTAATLALPMAASAQATQPGCHAKSAVGKCSGKCHSKGKAMRHKAGTKCGAAAKDGNGKCAAKCGAKN